MDLKSSKLIEKIAQLHDKPVTLSGYILKSGDDANDTIRLYPSLDPRCYYVFRKQCVVDTLATKNDISERVVVLLQPDCEIDVISQEHLSAKELVSTKRKRLCPCDFSGHDDPDIVFARKDDLRNQFIDLAKAFVELGVDELDCTKVSSLDAECCKAWNNLLDAAANGGNTFDAGNRVLAECLGIG
jgi:hypothetical protein